VGDRPSAPSAPSFHVKGWASPETKAAALLIEQAQTLGEAPDDGDMARQLAEQFLSLAEKQDAVAPRMIAHRMMGNSSLIGGEIATGRAHLDRGERLRLQEKRSFGADSTRTQNGPADGAAEPTLRKRPEENRRY
jgi:hypothetical protein